jgi:hypothetical protein
MAYFHQHDIGQIFMGVAQYLRKFIIIFSTTPLHALTANGKSFHWGKQQQRSFQNLKKQN